MITKFTRILETVSYNFFYETREQTEIDSILSSNNSMNPIADRERVAHNAATICSTCESQFSKSNYKVRHHCHVTGQYIAPVCNNYNLQLKNRKVGNKLFIPLFTHNKRSYDSHIIIKNLHDPNAKVRVIPKNSEKFLAVQIDSIRFLDSFLFLSSSLDKLVSTMARDNTDKFVHTKRHFGSDDPNIFKKGVYPYEYVKGPEILTETCLPPRDKFYSELSEEEISKENYDRALWRRGSVTSVRR